MEISDKFKEQRQKKKIRQMERSEKWKYQTNGKNRDKRKDQTNGKIGQIEI